MHQRHHNCIISPSQCVVYSDNSVLLKDNNFQESAAIPKDFNCGLINRFALELLSKLLFGISSTNC